MKLSSILVAIALILTAPFIMNAKITHLGSLSANTLERSNPCPQKIPGNTSSCSFNLSHFLLVEFDFSLCNLFVRLISFTYFFALCLGIKASIYKPPRLSPIVI